MFRNKKTTAHKTKNDEDDQSSNNEKVEEFKCPIGCKQANETDFLISTGIEEGRSSGRSFEGTEIAERTNAKHQKMLFFTSTSNK